MGKERFDCIVLGLGAMGSSTVYQLAKKNKKVLGLEQFTCAHSMGSSHGENRLIRKAYFEHSDYVPLLERSYELWKEIEKNSGRKLLHETGLVILGDPSNSYVLKGVKTSSETYGIPVELWDSAEIKSRFPQANVPSFFRGIFEKTGGFLEVENCVRTQCELASSLGAELRFEEPVVRWKQLESGFEVVSAKETYYCESLVITAGPWMSQWLRSLTDKFKVHRAPLFWFKSSGAFRSELGTPCYAFDTPTGFFYGFTEKEGLIKIALHLPLEEVSEMDTVNREIKPTDLKPVADFVKNYLKGISPEPQKSGLCFYTMSPDTHFIVDKVPDSQNAFFAGGFSGHGFKFSSLIGEVLSDWVVGGKTRNPVDFLSVKRF
ncbi:MAG: N-methyl-L-tryptophan oxidase [Proteobacteria bacterium]|nr:N-methyl-L-tryptophan oxidase [Pseudomonadota bacterium]NDC22981.1 N-methyl-L-tryptophan oxidase [Pseudomonadota bacterium]NDD03306.1 N-methyl-L-tryptophan oxidase [Pseudomonadota bacterium]NDG25676.1 N-methyl-L-tryptophan oxidase [Pseudomonadota bacterium]